MHRRPEGEVAGEENEAAGTLAGHGVGTGRASFATRHGSPIRSGPKPADGRMEVIGILAALPCESGAYR